VQTEKFRIKISNKPGNLQFHNTFKDDFINCIDYFLVPQSLVGHTASFQAKVASQLERRGGDVDDTVPSLPRSSSVKLLDITVIDEDNRLLKPNESFLHQKWRAKSNINTNIIKTNFPPPPHRLVQSTSSYSLKTRGKAKPIQAPENDWQSVKKADLGPVFPEPPRLPSTKSSTSSLSSKSLKEKSPEKMASRLVKDSPNTKENTEGNLCNSY
jgi:hypothetical protein